MGSCWLTPLSNNRQYIKVQLPPGGSRKIEIFLGEAFLIIVSIILDNPHVSVKNTFWSLIRMKKEYRKRGSI